MLLVVELRKPKTKTSAMKTNETSAFRSTLKNKITHFLTWYMRQPLPLVAIVHGLFVCLFSSASFLTPYFFEVNPEQSHLAGAWSFMFFLGSFILYFAFKLGPEISEKHATRRTQETHSANSNIHIEMAELTIEKGKKVQATRDNNIQYGNSHVPTFVEPH